ncbi:MAG: HlyD family efflux transporter periplasmic adaptor subunit [Gemmatimonadetes bacterium]|mgnify:CR=1 FL=1|jgi:multidrug resistance efflux pump|nr:HlyD family efflux transporter periplasmic adaptor subunit [Gemmatimonadota bacterium]
MSTTSVEDTNSQLLECLASLQQIRVENLEPVHFWPRYLEVLRVACLAEIGLVAVRGLEEGAGWQKIAFSPASRRSSPFDQRVGGKLDAAVEACEEEESALLEGKEPHWCAVRLKTGVEGQLCLALFYFGGTDPSRALEGVKILRLLNDLPINYQLYRSTFEEITRREQFTGVLDLMALMNEQDRFLPAAMTFCNELASRHQCEQVSLGWLKDGYIRVQAISHVDDFDKKMDAVQQLERVMEEAFDQDAEILLPSPDGQFITRDHESYARDRQVDHVCSVPLRVDKEVVAVCTFERNTHPFTEMDLRILRLYCDQAVRRLDDLRQQDRWFGGLLAAFLRKKLATLVGFKHTGAKTLAGLVTIVLAFFCLVPVTYRLESPVILRTEDVSFLTAPFDGYIEQVNVRVGDELAEGDTLLVMDQSDLFLEEAALAAEKNRYQRELEKSRADQALADMRIGEALYEQAAARFDLVRYHLSQSIIRAPAAGIVVEGDQMERVGSPVSQGDILFRLGRTDRIYAELEVPEAEIHLVNLSLDGEISLASQPEETFKIKVTRIEPSAVAKEEGNVFLVRCELSEGFFSWWKPGMTGVSKLNAGERTLLWIFTHRTMDFLRLRFWW